MTSFPVNIKMSSYSFLSADATLILGKCTLNTLKQVAPMTLLIGDRYGFIAEALVEWLQNRDDGAADMQEIVAQCSVAGVRTDVQFNTKQSDVDTFAVLDTTCKVSSLDHTIESLTIVWSTVGPLVTFANCLQVLNMTVEEVLFQVGQHQIPPLVAKGYLPVVQRLGLLHETFRLVSILDDWHAFQLGGHVL
jgi:hypothetical protein